MAKKTRPTKSSTKATRSSRPKSGVRKAKPTPSSVQNPLTDLIEQQLCDGANAKELSESLGEESYQELRQLAAELQEVRRKESTRKEKRKRVLILPGLLGSTLGTSTGIRQNTIWFDPFDIFKGKISNLKLPDQNRHASLGVIPFAYLKLKLRLQIAGFDADFFHYDWRQSLDQLGRKLIQRLSAEKHDKISLVAHSMGGMVARAAMATDGKKVDRLIMLGTPNFGSFEPVLALRAINETIRNVARLDIKNDAVMLAKIFSTFPGVTQLLPFREKFNDVDLYNLEEWPQHGPRPNETILLAAESVQKKLLADDPRFTVIAGVNRETVIGVKRSSDGSFSYQRSFDGDGTVPRELAVLNEERTYYVVEDHAKLPNNRSVASAVKQLLQGEPVTGLPTELPHPDRTWLSDLTEEPWSRSAVRTVPMKDWTHTELREIAAKFVSAEASEVEVPPVTEPEFRVRKFQDLVISRRRQKRFEIKLAHGDVAQLNTRALVLGMFQSVVPTGPARVLDRRLQGTISEFTNRRMFAANVGEIQILPTNRHDVRCDLVILAGLGAFDAFDETVMRRVAENIARCLLRAHVDEIGTVLIGAGSKLSIEQSIKALLSGFFRGLMDSPYRQNFRGITVCEHDEQRYNRIKDSVYELAGTELFEDTQVTLDEVTLPPSSRMPEGKRADTPDPAYLIARSDGVFSAGGGESEKKTSLNLSVLTASGKATIISAGVECPETELNALIRQVRDGMTGDSKEYGRAWADLVIPQEIKTVLLDQAEHHLVVVHDEFASRIPWETLTLSVNGSSAWSPAEHRGMSRRYLARNMSAAAWLSSRATAGRLEILLVVDPTKDLEGAELEGQNLEKLFEESADINVTRIDGDEATVARLKTEFSSGQYDIVHYAGHAFFDPDDPASSGILCAQDMVLSGRDLLGITNLPSLMFFNACEAARVRRTGPNRFAVLSSGEKDDVAQLNSGLAEAFLRGGVANYIGTYWPVSDAAAERFAPVFYRQLVAGETIGDAVHAGRLELLGKAANKSVEQDWANYILFGDHGFRMRQ